MICRLLSLLAGPKLVVFNQLLDEILTDEVIEFSPEYGKKHIETALNKPLPVVGNY